MLSVLTTHTHRHKRTHTHTQKCKGRRKCLEVIDTFISLIVVMVSWVYIYVQTHQDVYIKCVNFLYRLYLNKVF